MKKQFSNKSLLPFLFLVTVLVILLFLSLYMSQNSLLSREAGYSQGDLELNEALVKVLLKEGESFDKPLQISNAGSSVESVEIVVEDLYEILTVSSTSFFLHPGQTNTINLFFNTEVGDFSYNPGIYLGNLNVRSGEKEVLLPIVVEIESSQVNFDLNLDFSVIDRVVVPGGSAVADVTVYNFADTDTAVVNMNYVVSDFDGNRLISEEENLVVTNQVTNSKTINIPDNFQAGKYVYYVIATYGDSVGTASYIFEVGDEPLGRLNLDSVCSTSDPLCWVSFIILIILIFFVGAYAYFYLGAFLFKKIQKNLNKKDKKPNYLLYFLVILVITVLLIFLFYLSNVLTTTGLVSYLKGMPGWLFWLFLIVLILIVLLVIINYAFELVDWLKNRKKPIRPTRVELTRLQKEVEARQNERKGLLAKLRALRNQRKLVHSIKEEKENLAEEKKQVSKKKHSFFSFFTLKKKEKKKPKKRRSKEEILKQKEEEAKVGKEEMKLNVAVTKEQLTDERAKRIAERKEEALRKKKEMIQLKKAEKLRKAKEGQLEKSRKVAEKQQVTQMETELDQIMQKKKTTGLTSAPDPHILITPLLNNCDNQIKMKNLGLAESYYEQLKPVYQKLNEQEKRLFYSDLIELQNRLVMLRMSDFKRTLKPKRKTRKKKR